MLEEMNSKQIQPLDDQALREVNGGVAPIIVYGGYILGGAILGYLVNRKQEGSMKDYKELNHEELMETTGGIAPALGLALIAFGYTIGKDIALRGKK